MPHVHNFAGLTRLARYHIHGFSDRTGTEIMVRPNGRHRHRYNTLDERVCDHRHRLRNITGLSINIGGGRHIHRASGISTRVFDHRHRYRFTTGVNIPV
jgi:hypothetical protein